MVVHSHTCRVDGRRSILPLLILCGALGASCAFAQSGQTPVPTPKDCTGLSTVVWEQPFAAGDVVEWWQLVIAGTPQPTWPVLAVTPVPNPTGGSGALAFEHPVVPMPNGPFWLFACNEDGCSDPSNAMLCVSPTPTPTSTATMTPTQTATPIPTRTRKPKPHWPVWFPWIWR